MASSDQIMSNFEITLPDGTACYLHECDLKSQPTKALVLMNHYMEYYLKSNVNEFKNAFKFTLSNEKLGKKLNYQIVSFCKNYLFNSIYLFNLFSKSYKMKLPSTKVSYLQRKWLKLASNCKRILGSLCFWY